MLRKLVGAHHKGNEGSPENRPINTIELGTNIFLRHIASHTPQAQVTSDYQELLPTAYDVEVLLNREIEQGYVCDSFNTCSMEALFMMGVMVVGITTEDGPPTEDGYQFDAGHVFADPILFPDLILDMQARNWEQQQYIGHDFVVPLEWVAENPEFSKEMRDRFTEGEMWRQRNDEDWERIVNQSFDPTVRLRQLYLPRQQLVLIMAPDGQTNLPLKWFKWEGPKCGPYRPLMFGKVPGHMIPLAPVQLWYDLDDIINKCYAKTADQALRCKILGLAQNEDDARRINDAADGETVHVGDPKSVIEQTYGGPNRDLLGMTELSKQLLYEIGGNWPALAGLAPQSGTLGQDQLLTAGASGRLKDMQKTVVEFQTGVVSDMAYWLWHDPISQRKLSKAVEGTRFSIPSMWTPESRRGEFFQYNFKVNPYSLVNRSPTEQAQALVGTITNVLLPMLPYIQQGAPVDFEYLFKLLARYDHQPELNHLIKFPQGNSIQQPMPEMPTKSPVSKRTYERVNRPGGSQQGRNAALVNLLLGGQNQESENAAIMAPMV